MTVHTIVMMGPSGCGKTTVGQALAQATGARFVDADTYHPLINREKMAQGLALTDEDRLPWLASLAVIIRAQDQQSPSLVLACSALKQNYRDLLSNGTSDVAFICLVVPPAELKRRLETRQGHFFNPALLETQLSTLELTDDDGVDGTQPVSTLVRQIAKRTGWSLQ